MNAVSHAMLPENRPRRCTVWLEVRGLRFLRALAVLAVLLGSASAIEAQTVITLAWDANTEEDLAGYEVSYGTQPGVYSTIVDVGNVTSVPFTIVGNVTSVPFTLTSGIVYYFAVKAYDSRWGRRHYSHYSTEVSYDPPVTNRAPTLTQPPNQTSVENASVSLQLVASDPDGTAVTYSATGLPASLTVDAATGTISGSLSYTRGSYSVTATASDGALSNSQTFTWTVTDVTRAAPVVTWANPAVITSGTALGDTQLNAAANVEGTFAYTPAPGTVLSVGAQTLSVTFTPADSANYTSAYKSVTITVEKATPVVTWATPAVIAFGTTLSGTQLNATADVPGTFLYTPASGTVLTAGSGQTLTVTVTPTDTANYTTATKTVTIDVAKATTVVTWATPVAITYGTTLGAAQLNATAAVAGTFVYAPASGTVLNEGTGRTLSVSFTPADSANYTSASKTITIDVVEATPVITWAVPASVVVGTVLGATQLSATANVPGTFVYTPALGTVLPLGTQTLSVTFTPTDLAKYTTATRTVPITVTDVAKATPVITWGNPAAITCGTALGVTQLNATANVPGTFVYTPAQGTVLPAGAGQMLSVTFTPTDTANYTTATMTVSIDVAKVTPVVTWATPAAITFGTAVSSTQLNATADVEGTFVYTPENGTVLTAGADQTLSVIFTPTNTANYTTATMTVFVFVAKVTPVVTWATPAAIIFGTALSDAQLNATANVTGTFVYTPAMGAVLFVGARTLSVTFTPADSANYSTATGATDLVVFRAPTLAVTPATLRFAGTNTSGTLSPVTAAQAATVTFSCGAASTWSASADQPWVQITNGSGTGSGSFTVGMINPGNVLGTATSVSAVVTVTAAGASNSPQTVAVTLTLQRSGSTRPPIGLVDAPAQNATGQVGAIGVTGWVVDDVGVQSVKIYRNCLAFEPQSNCAVVNGVNLVYVGDATIVAGARPEIEAKYFDYPQNHRAAWGYLLLTNMLPHIPNQLMFGGQGTLTLYVLAEDMEGNKRWLGRDFMIVPWLTNETLTTFTMANDTIAKPFGAIDTPTQGQTVSGSFWNFGWTLTPDSNTTADADDILMPLNGSTQWVYVDGLAVAPLGAYNLCRGHVGSPVPAGLYCDDDVASIFGNPTPQPTFTTRTANPTRHRNLDAGRGPQAGFWLDTTTLSSGLHTIVWGVTDSTGRGEGIGSRYFTVLNSGVDAAAPCDAPVAARAPASSFDSRSGATALAQGVSDAGSDRPAGAQLIAPEGDPRLVAGRESRPDARKQAAEAALREAPAQSRGDARALETLAPSAGRVWGRTGYELNAPYAEVAADEAGTRHAQLRDLGRLELWLGAVERGYLVANGTLRDLPAGSHLDPETGQFTWAPGLGYRGTYRLVFVRDNEQVAIEVTISPMPPPAVGQQIPIDVTNGLTPAAASGESEIRMSVDVPRDREIVSGSFTVAGWALDPQAWTGSGIDAVHVWAQRVDAAAAPQFLGAAARGGARPDVAQVYGTTFGTASFSLTTDAVASGTYDLTVFAWNHRTARWEDARTVRVTVR